MNHVIKSVRLSTPTVSPNQLGKGTGGVRHRQVATASSKPERDSDMDKARNQQKPTEETEDVMSHPFGLGYATRSDDEGFGGIYVGNQSQANIREIHEDHPAYDKSQGSEVKEKEKARHQSNAS